MDKEDARKQTLLELHTRRKQVARLHRKGLGVMQIVQLSGLSWPAVRAALTLFEQGGWNALKPKARGKESGTGRALTPEQEQLIRGIICDKRPEQVKMDFALWNRGAVTILIERECGLKLTMRAVGNYLKRWGMTPQKPIKRAYEQKPEAVKAWLDAQYPTIEARAKAEGAEIHWGDETAVVNTDVRGRCYAPRGQTPVAYAVGGTRQKLSMISTVTNQGKARWMIIDENFNAELSPQLNPDERLNADLKYALGSTVAMRTKSTLWDATAEYMTMLEKSPERVKSYFQDPLVQYAA